MANAKIPIFKGIHTNKISQTLINNNESVDCNNIRIDNKYGNLNNTIGMTKWSEYGLYNPVVAIHQLKKHRYTNVDETLFSLSGGNWFYGIPVYGDYNFGYWYSTSESWNTTFYRTILPSTYFYGGVNLDVALNGMKLFLATDGGSTLRRYTLNTDSTITLDETYSFSINSSRNLYVDYNNDILIASFYNPGYLYSGIKWAIVKFILSTGTVDSTYLHPGLTTGKGKYVTQFTYNPDTNYIYFADRELHFIGEFEMDGSYSGYQTLGSDGSGVGQFHQPEGCCYYDGYYYICDTGNNRIIRTDISGGNWTVLTSLGTGTMKTWAPGYIVRDTLTGLFFISDYGNDRIIKTNFSNVWATYTVYDCWALSLDSNLRILVIGDGAGSYSYPRFLMIDRF